MKILLTLYKYYIKNLYYHKIDFILNIVNLILNQAFSFTFLYIIHKNVNVFNGWTFNQMMLIYGIFNLNKGISNFFTDSIYNLESHIQKGTLDGMLTRPYPVILQVLGEELKIYEIINILIGIILISIYMPLSLNNINIITFSILFLFLILSLILVFSIKLITISIAFWTLTSLPIAVGIDNISAFAKYPTNIYNKFIRIIINFLVPFSILAYYPLIILTKLNTIYIAISIIIVFIFFLISILVWKLGLKNYKSSGH